MQDTNITYLKVVVAAPLHNTLTYSFPNDGDVKIAPGMRLLVPLGRRLVTAYLLSFISEPPTEYKVKNINDVLDSAPIFPENMIPFYRWIANYYQYPIGEVIKGALPGGITTQSGRKVVLTDEGKLPLAKECSSKNLELPWIEDLFSKETLTPAATRKIWRTKDRRLLEKWSKRGWVEIEQVITEAKVKAKTETCIQLAKNYLALSKQKELKKSEQKTLDLLASMVSECPLPITRKDLAKKYSGARKALKSLEEKGFVHLTEQQVYRDPFGEPPQFFPRPEQLTGEQKAALDKLLPAIRQKHFTPFLLHGVTSSGKTEVYLEAAEATLAENRSVLVLVPEIALAVQLEGHFFSRFGDQVALLHSGLSAGERFDQWQRIASGEAKIVIGARSAIFAPLQDPGLIIVDEEHDGAYKQEDGLRYQARDLAILRASLQNATVILGSATPSITSYHHALSGKYKLLNMENRIEERPLPEVHVIDLQKVETVSGKPPLFSPDLTKAIKDNLANNEQTLIFLNRRGFANLMICKDCGQPVQCRNCHISLTLHKHRKELVCHYCGHTAKSASICSNCQSPNLVGIGFGTERIEEEITNLFPKAKIARLDRDTTTKRNDYLKILKAVHNRETDILIGTQMITKGHHFPHVTLVGIVWADAGLGIPDFRSGERTFQLLSQVTGRAGRGEKPGRVIIQTHQPQHYSITTAQSHDYQAVFDKELTLRKSLQFPPFSRLINLRFEGVNEENVKDVAMQLAHKARQISNQQQTISVLGPSPAPLSRLRNKYRWQLLLKGANVEKLHTLCARLAQHQSTIAGSNSVKLSVDVDPENML